MRTKLAQNSMQSTIFLCIYKYFKSFFKKFNYLSNHYTQGGLKLRSPSLPIKILVLRGLRQPGAPAFINIERSLERKM